MNLFHRWKRFPIEEAHSVYTVVSQCSKGVLWPPKWLDLGRPDPALALCRNPIARDQFA